MISGAWVLAVTLAVPHAPAPAAPADAWPDGRPFTHIIQNFVHDLAKLPSIPNAAILGVGTAGAIGLHSADQRLADWAKAAGPSSYTKIGDVAGIAYTQASVAVATYVAGKIAHNAEAVHIGSDLIRGQFLNGVFTVGLKAAVDRTRPTGSPHSFPSGHSSATFTTAAILQGHFGWKVGAPMYALAGFVGWTRLRDRQHYVSDVVFGSTMGILFGHTVVAGHRERSVTVVPVQIRGGAAVFVTWQPR